MPAINTYNNKVQLGGRTLMDISEDTVDADSLASGVTAHDASGAPVTGRMFPIFSTDDPSQYTPPVLPCLLIDMSTGTAYICEDVEEPEQ